MIEDYFIQAEKLHNEAMRLSDEAFIAKSRGERETALALLIQAASKEKQAADFLPPEEEYEPSRGILYRSAATLAYNSEDYKLADRLVATGLSGFPPPDVEKELKDLYEDINFMRHAEAEGIEISEKGLVMTIAGQATFYGGTEVDRIVKRLERLQKEFYRTVERLMGLEFRTEKPVDSKLREKFNLYLDTQFASSFGVYLLVGAPVNQPSLFPDLDIKEDIDGKAVIREVMECLKILESAEPERLKEKISDEAYYDDFVGFAKQIAPDGQQIKTVSFRSGAYEDQRGVILRKTREQIKMSVPVIEEQDDNAEITPMTLTGNLIRANKPAKGKFATVGLNSFEFGKKVTVYVPIGLIKDTVQPYFDETVIISGYEKNGRYYLKDIYEFQESTNSE